MQTGLVALELTSVLNRVPIDTRGLMRQFNVGQAELSKEELLRILKHQGFKSKVKRVSFAKLQKYPFPSIAVLKNGSYRTMVNLSVKDQKIFYFCPEKKQAASASLTVACARSNHAVASAVTRRAAPQAIAEARPCL